MSFRRDKAIKRRNRFLVVGVGFLVIVFLVLFLFGSKPFVSTGYRVATPFWQLSSKLDQLFSQTADLSLSSKRELLNEIASLKSARSSDVARLNKAKVLERENVELRQALGYIWPEESWLIAGVLVKPPDTPYDILVLDVGQDNGVVHDQLVFSSAGTILGVVKEVFAKQSFVVLLSTPGVRTDVVIESQGVAVVAEGKGGGVYEIHVPRSVEVERGDQIVLPGRQTEVLGQIGEVIFDPRDPFQTVFVSSSTNFYHERFVYISNRMVSDIPEIDTLVVEISNIIEEQEGAEEEVKLSEEE